MGLTVQMAGRLAAYTLTDRATWLRAGDLVNHSVLVSGDPQLINPYEVILVNPEKHRTSTWRPPTPSSTG